ncbi:hypothetical protein PLICRDRAFT_609030 [Plicaturopsis crispa FD-325 SS-3]|nr:hypothetical protein PLICRDRAFT_609030 [Plicaturopsis crispa FD-325 SS-3]
MASLAEGKIFARMAYGLRAKSANFARMVQTAFSLIFGGPLLATLVGLRCTRRTRSAMPFKRLGIPPSDLCSGHFYTSYSLSLATSLGYKSTSS